LDFSNVTRYWDDPLIAGLHVACAFVALACGLVVVLKRKGGKRHKQIGYVYVASMLAVNVSALLQAEINLLDPFVIAATVSLTTVAAAMACALRFRRTRSPAILAAHGTMMGWSYFGLLAAGLTQSLTASELYAYEGWARHEYGVYLLVALAAIWTIWHVNRDTKQMRKAARKGRERMRTTTS
jgi:uncharacterized membrane protein